MTSAQSSGFSAFELLTQTQIDAMAETLWDFTWNHDPNDPHFGEKLYADAGKPAKDHYREWARAIFLAAESRQPQHLYGGFPHKEYPSEGRSR